MNWSAVAYLTLQTAPIDTKRNDGRPVQLPVVKQQPIESAGDVVKVEIVPPPAHWKPILAVGDLLTFESILGNGIRPYKGPACLVGLDHVLAQRRAMLKT
jgi:hypothetical protein